MVDLLRSPWRNHFQKLLDKTQKELVITSPYIKKTEADYICENLTTRNLSAKISFRLLTDLRSQSILDSALDVEALQVFQDRLHKFELLTLPGLHAKVYIFDNAYAVVGSSNLTPSGFEYNYEYSVGISDLTTVQKIRIDIDNYSRIGNKVGKEKINELCVVAQELKEEYERVSKSATSSIKRKFNETLQKADTKFIEALVGKKTAYSIFKEAVIYCLTREPLSTQDLEETIKHMLPRLCIDQELVINGQKFGKVWKHKIRTVLNDLRRRGNLKQINKVWAFLKS